MTVQLTKEVNGATVEAEPGPPAPVRIPWAPVPKVNLLPIEIIENRRFRRTQMLLGTSVVAALVLAGAGTYWAQRGVAEAGDQLVAAQAKVSIAQSEKSRYAAVPKVIAEVDAARASRTLAMGNDVLWYRYLNDIDGARPTGIKLSGITLTLNAATAVATDPLSQPGIGVLAMEGTADKYGQVANWLEALNKITGVASSTLANAAQGENGVTFGSGAVVTSDALSGRYQKKAG